MLVAPWGEPEVQQLVHYNSYNMSKLYSDVQYKEFIVCTDSSQHYSSKMQRLVVDCHYLIVIVFSLDWSSLVIPQSTQLPYTKISKLNLLFSA